MRTGGLIEFAIREALDALVAPDRRDEILRGALALSGLERLPQDAPTLARFVDGPLTQLVRAAVGDDAADQLRRDLSRFSVFVPESDPRPPSYRPAGPSLPTPVVEAPHLVMQEPSLPPLDRRRGDLRRVVLLASRDATSGILFEHALQPFAELVRVEDVVEWLAALEDSGGAQRVLVLDARSRAVLVPAAAALAERVPHDVVAFVWGAELPESVTAALEGRVARVVTCAREADPGDLATLATNLLERLP